MDCGCIRLSHLHPWVQYRHCLASSMKIRSCLGLVPITDSSSRLEIAQLGMRFKCWKRCYAGPMLQTKLSEHVQSAQLSTQREHVYSEIEACMSTIISQKAQGVGNQKLSEFENLFEGETYVKHSILVTLKRLPIHTYSSLG